MSEAVVQLLEVVNVTHQDRNPFCLLGIGGSDTIERFYHPSPVGDSRQRIRPCKQFQPCIGIGQIRQASAVAQFEQKGVVGKEVRSAASDERSNDTARK